MTGKSQSHIALGYHSPTEWVFIPALNGLYDSFTINQEALEAAIAEGKNTASDYLRRKADALSYLKEAKRLIPRPYKVPDSCRPMLLDLVSFLFSARAEEMRRLVVGAFETFIAHEQGTVAQLMHPDDPHAVSTMNKVSKWKKVAEDLKTHPHPDEVPGVKASMVRYFEECLYTPMLFPDEYNPVFQWEGYAPFQEFLLSLRIGADRCRQEESIQKGTTAQVMRAVAETALCSRPLRDSTEIARLDKYFSGFEGIRRLASEQNAAIWKQLQAARSLSPERDSGEFVREFELFLATRMAALNTEIRETETEIDRERRSLGLKVKRFILQTLGSQPMPFLGGVSGLLEDLYAIEVEKKTLSRHPVIAMLREYERTMDKVILERPPLKATCSAESLYVPHRSWDE